MKRWPQHNAWFWESAPFFRVLLPVVAGIVGYNAMHASWLFPYALSATLVSFVVFAIAVFYDKLLFPRLSFIAFNCAILLGMWCLCWCNDVCNYPHCIGMDTTGYTLVRIVSPPIVKEKTTRLTVQAQATVNKKQINGATGQAYVYTYNSDSISVNEGDSLLLRSLWQPVTNRGNPFEYDYAGYCARNGIHFMQFARADEIMVYGHGADKPGIITRWHNWCMQQLDANIPDRETCGLVQAMLLGDEGNLDPRLRQAWAQTGIIHIIAISGGNISVFFVIIACLLWWMRHKKHLWIKYMIALPLVWLYVAVAGASPSAVRAAVMFSLLAVSLALQTNNNSLNTLFAAGVLLLVAQPMWLYTASFQLSFVAILSLILFYGPVYSLYQPKHYIVTKLWEVVASSLAVELLVAPLVIAYFYMFPLPFLVSNVLAFVFMTAVLVLGIGILVLGSIPLLGKLLGMAIIFLSTVFNNIIYNIQYLNPPAFNYLYLTGWELIFVYVVIAALALFILWKYKPGLFMAIVSACVLVILLCIDEYTALRQQRFVAYNTGDINQIEVITGKGYRVINTDIHTLAAQKDYTLKPAHAAWRAWQANTQENKKLFVINGRSVLLLDEPVYSGNFPVDYLVVNLPPGKVHPATLARIFRPRVLVFGSNYSRAQTEKWIAACERLNIKTWHTATDGAFIWGTFSGLR